MAMVLARSRVLDADHEQPSLICCTDHFVPIDHDRCICFDRDARKSSFGRQHHSARPDRWPVGATLLAGLLDFNQHASRPFAAEYRTPPQELVGSFYRLHTEDESLLNHDCLANVEDTQGPSNGQPVLDIRFGSPIRSDDTERAGTDDFAIKKLIGAYDPKALLLQFADDG
jgi:hypothetical protein